MEEESYKITDIFDVTLLQKFESAFSELTGLSCIITDTDGKPVTHGANYTTLCGKYITNSSIGRERCAECVRNGVKLALDNNSSCPYTCHGGLIDFAAPLMAGEQLIGSIIGGQVLIGKPDPDVIAEAANALGISINDYIELLKKVPVMPLPTVKKCAKFLYQIADIISNLSYHNYVAMQSNKEIEHESQMKSDFLANMSHEIRTPMNGVIGMAEMALRENLPPTARDYILQIKSSGKTLLAIINDILDFSKIESGKMDINMIDYQPLSIVNDIGNMLITRIEDKDVELILDINPNIPCGLLGDNIRIKQVIVNIVNNATKFTQHGQVALHITYAPKSEDEITLLVAVEDTGIGIKKQDMGKLFHSFKQLDSKRNRNIEGTGLGLSISKQLLTLMYGDIDVSSEYGKGSTFSFSLPQRVINSKPSIMLNDRDNTIIAGIFNNQYVKNQFTIDVNRLGAKLVMLNSDTELNAILDNKTNYFFIEQPMFNDKIKDFIESHTDITGVLVTDFFSTVTYDIPNLIVIKKPLYVMNIAAICNHEDIHMGYSTSSDNVFTFVAPEANILIVDDNAINLTVVRGLLEPLRMKIDTAASGKEALEMISQNRYNIIFMDHMMPEMDGIETTHIIREKFKDYDTVPIIALTANAVDGASEMFLLEGMNDFVAKPIELNVIVGKLERWLPKSMQKPIAESPKSSSDSNSSSRKSAIAIKELDTASALKLLGSEKLFWDVLKDYYRVIDKKTNLISTYEKNEDWHSYTIEVHSLKSASRQIGATKLADLAEAMEKAGNARDGKLIHEKTGELLKMYSDLKLVLDPYFPKEEENDDGKQSLSADTLFKYLTLIKAASDDLDSDTLEKIVKEMKKYKFIEWEKEQFTKICNAVDDIDTETCFSLADEWIGKL